MKPIGLYIHVPFCASKCPYCDFYSMKPSKELLSGYSSKINEELISWGNRLEKTADTLYFGGGTPSLLDGSQISEIIKTAKQYFGLKDAEISLECNPSNDFRTLLPIIADAGVNRLSIGLQSAVDAERKSLGRRAGKDDVTQAIKIAKSNGIENISLDLMLGIPKQTMDSLKESLDFCANSGAKHISVYMLKIEEDTKFFEMRDRLDLPSEDMYCDMYLETCEQLKSSGFEQYEISNFAIRGYESRHNLKYWNDEEYLGLGPSAHSFLDGKRFFYDRNLEEYMKNPTVINDGEGGNFNEYIMLKLRLSDGIDEKSLKEKFGYGFSEKFLQKAKELEAKGLIEIDGGCICLTRQGFLLSNTIICELLQD